VRGAYHDGGRWDDVVLGIWWCPECKTEIWATEGVDDDEQPTDASPLAAQKAKASGVSGRFRRARVALAAAGRRRRCGCIGRSRIRDEGGATARAAPLWSLILEAFGRAADDRAADDVRGAHEVPASAVRSGRGTAAPSRSPGRRDRRHDLASTRRLARRRGSDVSELDEVLATWRAWQEAQGLSERTIADRAACVRRYVALLRRGAARVHGRGDHPVRRPAGAEAPHAVGVPAAPRRVLRLPRPHAPAGHVPARRRPRGAEADGHAAAGRDGRARAVLETVSRGPRG
jgi:hypothetical protein